MSPSDSLHLVFYMKEEKLVNKTKRKALKTILGISRFQQAKYSFRDRKVTKMFG